ncbi:ribosome maturation factor RimM [Eubacteriaceae bacterium ES3]|nr:ribosome maturation factor RimM [Eubacteriaceae bacterium ES3]
MSKDTMVIGRVSGVHGIKGEVKVLPLTDDHERFYALKKVTLLNQKSRKEFVIDSCRLHKNSVLLNLNGVTNRNAAELLIGMEIMINRDQAVELNEDEYFVEDLKGMEVFNEQEFLGKLTDILQTGGVDVYMIKGNKREYCVPARKIYFVNFDFANNRIEANIPKEILEI